MDKLSIRFNRVSDRAELIEVVAEMAKLSARQRKQFNLEVVRIKIMELSLNLND